MRPAEPRIGTTLQAGTATFDACHETPEGQRLIRSLRAMAQIAAFVGVSVLLLRVLSRWPADLTDGERMVVMALSLAVSFGISMVAANALADARFGFRCLLDRRIRLTVSRDGIGHNGTDYRRDRKIAFTSEPHRWARREERAERVSGETIPETYRLAYEVKLQHGEVFIVLAHVSDEQAANAIARRLQALDELVTRGAGSLSRSAFGPRQVPE